MTPEQKESLIRMIGARAEGLFEHASAFFEFWKDLDADDQDEALSELLQKFKLPEFRNDYQIEGQGIPGEHLAELTNRVGMLVEATISVILKNRLPMEEAGKEVRALIDGRTDEEEKVFCLAGIMASNIVPYAALPEPETRLSNEAYQEALKTLSEGVAQIRIASGACQNAAEMSDLILSILENEEDRENQVALLAYFIVLRERTVAMGQMTKDAQQAQQAATASRH